MPLTHWHSEWVFSLILTLSRHNFLDLGASVGWAGQKGSWDWPEGSQALQHRGIYLDTIRNGPEPWNSCKNPNSPEVGVIGEACIWVSPVEIWTSQLMHSQNFPKTLPGFTFWGIFLKYSVIRKNLVKFQCTVICVVLLLGPLSTSDMEKQLWHEE